MARHQPSRAGVDEGLEAWRQGRPVLIVDDFRDMGVCAVPSAAVTEEVLNFLVTHCRGIPYVILSASRLAALGIPAQAGRERSLSHLHVPVDVRQGTTTGISIADRLATIQALLDPASEPQDFLKPGHLSLVAIHEHGLDGRFGVAEAVGELEAEVGGYGSATVAAVLGESGELADIDELCNFGSTREIPLVSIADVVRHRRRRYGWNTHEPGGDVVTSFVLLTQGIQVTARARGTRTVRDEVPVVVHQLCVAHQVLRGPGACRVDLGDSLERLEQSDHGIVAVWTWLRPKLDLCVGPAPSFLSGLMRVLAADLVGGWPADTLGREGAMSASASRSS